MKVDEKKLLQYYRNLVDDNKATLLKFAEFLKQNQGADTITEFPEPQFLMPAENETVVGALKRLSASYPMLDKAKMLNETSTLMTQHVMQGRDKQEVISELEVLFEMHYTVLKKKATPND